MKSTSYSQFILVPILLLPLLVIIANLHEKPTKKLYFTKKSTGYVYFNKKTLPLSKVDTIYFSGKFKGFVYCHDCVFKIDTIIK